MSKEPLTAGHYHEALDRAHTIQVMVQELLRDHPVFDRHPLDLGLTAKLDKVEEAVSDLYQSLGKCQDQD